MAPVEEQAFSTAASGPPTTTPTMMASGGTNATSSDTYKSTQWTDLQTDTKITTDASTFSTSVVDVHQTSSDTTEIPPQSTLVSASSEGILRSTSPVTTQSSHPLSLSSLSTTGIQSMSPPLTPTSTSDTGVHTVSQTPEAMIRSTTQSATRSSTGPTLTTVDVSQTPGWMRTNRSSQASYATQSQQGISAPAGGGTNTSTIVAGVLVPLILIGVGALIIYIWYRRKYPVRMVIGKDFSKFSNPMYNKRASTLTLVRNDAEQEWERINALSLKTPELTVVNEEPEGNDNKAYAADNHYENAEIKENEIAVVVVEQTAEENEIPDEKVEVKLITRERPKTKKAVLVKTEETDDFSENGFELVTEDDLGVRTESELSSGNDSTETNTVSLTFSETFDDRHEVQCSEHGQITETNERNVLKLDSGNGDVSNEIKEIRGNEELSFQETLSTGKSESFNIVSYEHVDVSLETNQDYLSDQQDQPQSSLERAVDELLPVEESTTNERKSIIPDHVHTTDGLDDPNKDDTPEYVLSNHDMSQSFEILNNSSEDEIVNDKVEEATDFSESNNSKHQSMGEIKLDKALNKTLITETNTAIENLDVNDIVEKERIETLEKDQQRNASLSDSEDQLDSKMSQKEKGKSKSLDSINDFSREFGIVKRSPLTSNENIVLEAEPPTPIMLVQDSIIFESENLLPVVLDNTHVSPVRGRRAFTLNDIHFKKSPSFIAFDNSGLIDDTEQKSKSSPEIYGKDKTGEESMVLKLKKRESETGSKSSIRTDHNVETEHIYISVSSTDKTDKQKDTPVDVKSKVDAGDAEVSNKNAENKEAINTNECNEDMTTNQVMTCSFVSQNHTSQSFQSDDSDLEQNFVTDEQKRNPSQQKIVQLDENIITNTCIQHFFTNIEDVKPKAEKSVVKQTENEMFTPTESYLEGDLFSSPFLKSSTPTASWVHEQSENYEPIESSDEYDSKEIADSKNLGLVTTRKKVFAPLLDLNKFDDDNEDDDDEDDDNESENNSESSSETSQYGLTQSINKSENSSKNSSSLFSLDVQNSKDNKADNDVIIGDMNKSTDSSLGLSWEVIKETSQESRTSRANDLSDNKNYDFEENNVINLKGEKTVSPTVNQMHLEASQDSAVNQNISQGNSTDVSWDFINEEGDNSEC